MQTLYNNFTLSKKFTKKSAYDSGFYGLNLAEKLCLLVQNNFLNKIERKLSRFLGICSMLATMRTDVFEFSQSNIKFECICVL